jgi:hypothetical protein
VHLRSMALVIVGALLIAPVAVQAAIAVLSVHSPDVRRALNPLARISLAELEGARPVVLSVTVPADRQWRRISRDWGRPQFLVAAVTPGDWPDRRTYSPDEVKLTIRVRRDHAPIPTRPTNEGPYSYSTELGSNAILFDADDGQPITIDAHSAIHGQLPAGELLVIAHWNRMTIKDTLAVLSSVEKITRVTASLACVGLAAIALGIYRLERRRQQMAR